MSYAKYLVIAVLLASIVSMLPNMAYSLLEKMNVRVDKPSYRTGETIMISGNVPTILEGVPVTIQVFNPRDVLYVIDQVMPNEDGTFSSTVKIGGKLGISGTYTVRATYLSSYVLTKFEFVSAPELAPFRIDGFEIKASLSNGSINKIEVDEEFKSLIISVSTGRTDGTLTITLPRAVIDSRLNGNDDAFVVIVNGEEVEYRELRTTATERELSIPVRAGAEEIEIIGTYVIPEFGILAALVLVAAIGAIVVISRVNRVSMIK